MRNTDFKRRELFQDVPCRHNYAERVVASFTNKIQSEYYDENISVSLEGIALEHFSALAQECINSTTISHQRHAVFHFLYVTIANRVLVLLLHTSSV